MSSFVPSPDMPAIVIDAARGQLRDVAEKGARIARRNAPVKTGAFRSSIHAFDDRRGVGFQSADPAAVPIEYGSDDTPPHGTIRSAASELGEFQPR